MTKDIWINLPVKDVKRTTEFFTQIGFSFNSVHGNTDVSAAMKVGEKNVVVMFFDEETFQGFTQHAITDSQKSSEVLISFDAEVRKAGGIIFGEPGGNDWLYGFGFADPDGHRWNALHMDMSKMHK
jgi:predicted lactoylglutathione lyase